tara:strand:+ start:87 stop:275 length:189 start_codon:yes stop_codon:yes gene_type:complete
MTTNMNPQHPTLNPQVENAVDALSHHMLEHQHMTQAEYQAILWSVRAALHVMRTLITEEMIE